MKRFGIALGLLWINYALWAAPAPKLSYTVSPLKSGDHRTFLVEMRLKGSATGETALTLPFETGLYRPQDQLSILGVTNSHRHHRAAGDSALYIISHKPNAPLTVRYTITNALKDTLPTGNEVHAQMLTPHYFYLIGSSLWVTPGDSLGVAYDIAVTWKGFPAAWSLLNTYGANRPVQQFRATLDDLQNAVYMGGDFRIHTIRINDKPLHLGIRGRWNFSDEAVLDLIRRTVSAQRAYWNDYDIERYTIGLLPMKYGTEDERSMFGRGFANTFVTVGTNSRAFGLPDLTYLYNHELMHHWLGHVLKQANPENAYKWFHEGFTDYFAHVVMREGGLLDNLGYKTRVSNIFASYYNDSTHQWPNQKLQEDYWSTPQMQQLPYQRGLLFAFYLDESIRLHSSGRSSLKDVVRQLLTDAKAQQTAFSQQRLLALLQEATGKDYTPELERFITRGAFIALSDWQAVTDKVAPAPTDVYDLGFTTDRGIALNAIITSVAEGSNVHRAGLRAGDVMVGFSSKQHPAEWASITVKRGDEELKFRFLPARQVWVPQLK